MQRITRNASNQVPDTRVWGTGFLGDDFMIRVVNVFLLGLMIISAFCLINRRYQTRVDYARLAVLKNQADFLNKEFTRLEIEAGTFSSNLVLQNVAVNKLGLIQADKNHIVGIK